MKALRYAKRLVSFDSTSSLSNRMISKYLQLKLTKHGFVNGSPGQATALTLAAVGFFLARDAGFTRMFADVIRGYEVVPGGFLALDLHGTACVNI